MVQGARPRGILGSGLRTESRSVVLAAFLFLLVTMVSSALAATLPDQPPSGRHIVDEAQLVRANGTEVINRTASDLLGDKGVPLYVVTLRSLASREAADLGVERYTRLLFDGWGVGTQDHSLGLLLLVAKEDRAIHIELGADWSGEHNAAARDIVYEVIVPYFQSGRLSSGVIEGVASLDRLVRNTEETEAWRPPQVAVPSKRRIRKATISAALIGAVILFFMFVGRSKKRLAMGAGDEEKQVRGGGSSGSW